ncbi:Major facilitator superfamily domain-containing protein 1 [Channa argus]|uniref:Lysosomal dipeptide transporter MFSD1 n=1 Tax=Channa argus TaxID=215402 RepID=A0A6G1PQY4_CHAAH|nr:Major facilitator superfamily domain-containing protein 1 [Channa argus]
MIDRSSSLPFSTASPKQVNMAGFDERRSLLGDEGERSFASGQTPDKPSRPMLAICDPSHLLHRVVVLVFMCFLGFGSYFCYDNPAALQTQVIQDLNLNTASFMQLYAWYSWPNVVLCFFGGFLLDRVFGISIGGESLAVAQNTYAVNWFKGKELNLVFGLQLSMARLGSTVNMNIMGWVYSKVAALIGSSGYTALGTSLMIGEVVQLKDVKDFPLPLWLIFIICVAYYVAIFPFIGLGQVFFIEKFNFSPAEARAVNSIVYIISAPASPVLGFVVDRTGRNVVWVMLAVITTLASHMMLAFTFWNPWIAMSLLGVSYSLLACALWPMVAFVVPEHQLGTAYGLHEIDFASDSPHLFFLFLSVALMAVVMLYFVDYLRGGDLNQSASTRAKLQKEATSDADSQTTALPICHHLPTGAF